MWPFRRIQIFAFLFLLVLQYLLAGNVAAHGIVVRSDPVDGAVLTTPPERVTIWFDENVLVPFSDAELRDSANRPVPGTQLQGDPAHPDVMIVLLPPLEEGIYSLWWRALSAADGHYSQGILVFGVGENFKPPASGDASSQYTFPEWFEVGLRWLHFTSLLLAIGALLVIRFVLPGVEDTRAWHAENTMALEGVRHRLHTLARRSAGLAVIVGIGLLIWETSRAGWGDERGSLIETATYLLLRTQWGQSWLVREGAIALLWLLVGYACIPARQRANSRGFWTVVAFLIAAALIAQAFSSHASGVNVERGIAILMDVLHLLAAAMWAGGLLGLLLGTWYGLRKEKGLSGIVQHTWRRFGLFAAFAVGLLISTGLYSTGAEIASIDALLVTFYGNVWMVKTLLVLGALLIGGINTALLHPAIGRLLARLLRRPEGWTPVPFAWLPKLILCESIVILAIVQATAFMTASPAPRGIEHTIIADEIPTAIGRRVDDLVITLRVTPNRPGQNVFTVFVASKIRPAPAEITQVLLRFRNKTQDTGVVQAEAEPIEDTTYTLEPLEQGRYMVTGDFLNLAGPWSIEVVVRRQGLEDAVAQIDWIVAPAGALRPVVVSKAPIRRWTNIGSAGALILLTILLGIGFAAQNKTSFNSDSSSSEFTDQWVRAPEDRV